MAYHENPSQGLTHHRGILMPCNADYLNPTTKEREHQRAAKLIIFVDSFFDKSTESWIIRQADDCYANDKRLIPTLCARLKALSPEDKEKIIYNAKSMKSRSLADWYETHEKADRDREKKELEEKNHKTLVNEALSKLNSEERNALRKEIKGY